MPKELVAPNILIRRMQPSEYAWALALNNSEVPHVSACADYSFPRFVESAAWAPVAVRDNKPVGFAILFLAGSTYASENYRWVAARYTRFLYLDRIIVDPAHRGQGIGHALYEQAIEFGRRRAPILTCEVNEKPPNPDSMRFHEKLGFLPIGHQTTEGGKKSVVIMGLDLAS
ncbi:MAG: GNAT family N-acetyltransferase [Alphaproteobacteria bacterium]|jgi:predicted GNAT superfamily acetyltransferase|nr:GNAT family N-acetyltransferase [Alphaproteobacteria bacterium]